MNAPIHERDYLLEENNRLREALRIAVAALDGVVDGDLVPNGRTVKSALGTGSSALSPPSPDVPITYGRRGFSA